MKNLKTLVFMQLKDKLDFSYLKSIKKTIFKVVTFLLKFFAITSGIYIGFLIVSHLRLVSTFEGIPQDFFTVVFAFLYILSIITCSFGLSKTLYESRDNQLLLTLPAKRTTVFTSKLIVYYVYECIRNINYLFPLFVAFGIINEYPLLFYFWLVFIYFLIVAVPVVIGALLSIPTMLIKEVVLRNKWLEYLLLILSVGAVSVSLIFIIRAIPENIDLIGTWGSTFWEIRRFLNKFISSFSIFYYIVISVTGIRNGVAINILGFSQMLTVLFMILGIVVVIALTYGIVKPIYFKMTSSPFEYKKNKINKRHKNYKLNFFYATIKKDLILLYREGGKFYSLLALVIGLPISIVLLNKLYSAMDTRLIGTNMTITFNILMILLIVLSSNVTVSRIYSEEGSSNYLLKTSPKTHLKSVAIRLVPNAFFITISIIITVILMCKNFEYSFFIGMLVFCLVESFYLSHMFMSAEMDIMNPQSAYYQTSGAHYNNPNEIRSLIYAFLISFGVSFILFFLISENSYTVWLKLSLVGLVFLLIRIWLYVNRVKLYFKERS